MEIEELKDLAIKLEISKGIIDTCKDCEDCIIGLIKYKYSQDNLKAMLENKEIIEQEINMILNNRYIISDEQKAAINSLNLDENEIENNLLAIEDLN